MPGRGRTGGGARHDHGVRFFDDFPGHVERRLPDGASGPPSGMIGGFVPWRTTLVRTHNAWAAVQDFEAFPSGILFELVARVEDWDPDPSARTHTLLDTRRRCVSVSASATGARARPIASPSEHDRCGSER